MSDYNGTPVLEITGEDEDTIHEILGSGCETESVGDLAEGDPLYLAYIEAQDIPDARSYGYEENAYGQRVCYRFATDEDARRWFYAVAAQYDDFPLPGDEN